MLRNVTELLLTSQANASTQSHLKYYDQCHSIASLTSQVGPIFRGTRIKKKGGVLRTQGCEMWKSYLLGAGTWATFQEAVMWDLVLHLIK